MSDRAKNIEMPGEKVPPKIYGRDELLKPGFPAMVNEVTFYTSTGTWTIDNTSEYVNLGRYLKGR